MNYDRLYDMPSVESRAARAAIELWHRGIALPNNVFGDSVRETGVEPASLAAPDPKSSASLGNTPSPQGASATSRQQSPPAATQTTTDRTTDLKSAGVSPRCTGVEL